MLAIPPILTTAHGAYFFTISWWNKGANGAPSPPAAISLERKSEITVNLVFSEIIDGLHNCKVKDFSGLWRTVCPWTPIPRISSVFRHIGKNVNDKFDIKSYDFNYSSDEIKILQKISQWPKCIEISSKKLEPHRVPVYLYELASQFHSYWNLGKDDESKRFINEKKNISDEKIALLKAVSNVNKQGMSIVGVGTPEKM